MANTANPGHPEQRVAPQVTPPLGTHHIVLWGAGHTNAHILRMWAMDPIPDTRLTCVSNFPIATYSGMLPAFLAGQCERDDLEIDLVSLCKIAGVRLIIDSPIGLDGESNSLLFEQRPPMPFDALSIGIGSVPSIPTELLNCPSSIAIKPMQTFTERLLHRAEVAMRAKAGKSNLRVAIIGAGAAGVEIALCLPKFFARQPTLQSTPFEYHLSTRAPEILPGELASTRKLAMQKLTNAGITVNCQQSVDRNEAERFDLAIWATGAKGSNILGKLGLPVDSRGFLLTKQSLQSVANDRIFVVGDSGTLRDNPTPKAGVYAVRQGPVLWENLQRVIDGKGLKDYQPQRRFLKLLNTADGGAIAQNWSLSSYGKTWWKAKEWIDKSFMQKFRLQPMQSDTSDVMQCSGCGCKLPASALEIGLAGTQIANPEGDIGSHQRSEHIHAPPIEDAIEVAGGKGRLLASTDFFSLPTDDAWLAGRIATIHSASDLIVSGATPTQLLANVVIPAGSPRAQVQWFTEFQVGAALEAERIGATIAGGHTIVGPRAEAGFTVLGELVDGHIRKGSLKPGDRLYVTKPLGFGVILAAYGAGRCDASSWTEAIDAMLATDAAFPRLAADLEIEAATDITGFGVAGHLIEMLQPAGLSARLDLERLPILPGARRLLARGIRSSLWESNRRSYSMQIDFPSDAGDHDWAILFDPQTCGGVLFASNRPEAEIYSAFLEHSHSAPVLIGTVSEREAFAIDFAQAEKTDDFTGRP